ncbi:MarR family transcriptional regulator [Anoxybacillus flavithermus]|uniref:MarR family transcriptional regulator n=1 Tax=Anoxybacillus flavithermus TaxID=33934 RepID=UPI003B982A32
MIKSTTNAVNFTHYEDNTLRNEDGEYCTQKDIVEKSGCTKSTVSKIMKRLIDKKLIFEIEAGNSYCEVRSPRL